jgi:hypothetical protein
MAKEDIFCDCQTKSMARVSLSQQGEMKLLATACCLLAVAPLALSFTIPATSFGRPGVKVDKFSNRKKCDGINYGITGQTGNIRAGFLDALFGNAKQENLQSSVTPSQQGLSNCPVTMEAPSQDFCCCYTFIFSSLRLQHTCDI